MSKFLVACNSKHKEFPQQQTVEDKQSVNAISDLPQEHDYGDSLCIMSNHIESQRLLFDEKGRKIYLSVDSNLVTCYIQKGDNQPQKLIFGHVYCPR